MVDNPRKMRNGPAVPYSLTAREMDVLRLVAQGATNGEIAAAASIGDVTVKTHVGHIFTKLGVRDRAGAIVFAYDNSVVVPAVDGGSTLERRPPVVAVEREVEVEEVVERQRRTVVVRFLGLGGELPRHHDETGIEQLDDLVRVQLRHDVAGSAAVAAVREGMHAVVFAAP